MQIRRATIDDAAACAEIHRLARLALAFLPPNPHTPAHIIAWKRDIVLVNECVWLAEEADRALGYAALNERTGELTHLYVRPGDQGYGVGAALLAVVKVAAPGRLFLWTFEDNKGAIRFYERHGFVTAERTDGRRNAEQLPDRRLVWRG